MDNCLIFKAAASLMKHLNRFHHPSSCTRPRVAGGPVARWPPTAESTGCNPCCPLTPAHGPLHPPRPKLTLRHRCSLLSTQSCSAPWPRAVPHYGAVRKLLGAPVTLKDWWRKTGRRRGEEQVVKKRMSRLMGCQECNSIIMKSDSGVPGWMDGWMAAARGVGAGGVTCRSIGRRRQVNGRQCRNQSQF